MARSVKEIMNHELVALRPTDTVEEAIGRLVAMGVSGAPVVDLQGRPIGVVSFHDLVARAGGPVVNYRMTAPAVVIERTATIEAAARELSERGIHRLVVVDDRGLVVGIVSALDCMRALCGIPTEHPASFPHYDPKIGASFSDDRQLCPENVQLVPREPGILVLRVGGVGRLESDVWLEASNDLRTRLRDMLLQPHEDRRLLDLIVRYGPRLRFRYSVIADADRRRVAFERLKADRELWVHVPNAEASAPPAG